MNVYDSARMADVLAPLGYAPADSAEDADLVILNTCHIREKASEKVYSELGRLRLLKAERPGYLIAVAGCTAQAEGAEIVRRMPFVDVVVGPQAYHRLPELVARASRAGGAALDTEFPVESKFDHLPQATGAARGQRLPDDPGGLRQVLHLLRRALHARRRVLAARRPRSSARRARSSTRVRARSRCWARTSTPITAATRRAASSASAISSAAWRASRSWRACATPPRIRATSTTPGRRAWRGAEADALPAPAGAVRLRPHPRRHESRPHRRAFPAHRRAAAPRAAGSRAVERLHRRLSRRERRRFRGDARSRARRCASPPPSRSSTARDPAHPPR
jgi:hypothetical protein